MGVRCKHHVGFWICKVAQAVDEGAQRECAQNPLHVVGIFVHEEHLANPGNP